MLCRTIRADLQSVSPTLSRFARLIDGYVRHQLRVRFLPTTAAPSGDFFDSVHLEDLRGGQTPVFPNGKAGAHSSVVSASEGGDGVLVSARDAVIFATGSSELVTGPIVVGGLRAQPDSDNEMSDGPVSTRRSVQSRPTSCLTSFAWMFLAFDPWTLCPSPGFDISDRNTSHRGLPRGAAQLPLDVVKLLANPKATCRLGHLAPLTRRDSAVPFYATSGDMDRAESL